MPITPLFHSGVRLKHRQRRILRIAIGGVLAATLGCGSARSAHSYTREGFVLSHRGEYRAATTAFDQALKIDSNDAEAYYGRGVTQLCAGQYDAAISDYTSAIRLDPRLIDYRNRSYAYEQTGDYVRALADLNEAINLDPKDSMLYLDRASLYGQSGEVQAAQADLDKAADINRVSPALGYANGRAWILATSPSVQIRDPAVALRLATETSKVSAWSNPLVLDTLAAAYAQTGQFDNAIKWQKKACELAQAKLPGRLDELQKMNARLALYEKHQPYVETKIAGLTH
jgi:tetratricopeptide (TPR) repeat protein